MSWRRGEVWLDTELLWFRERAAGAVAASVAQTPLPVGLIPEGAGLGPVSNGLAESRRRRAELRRRRRTRKTRAAALVLAPTVMLSLTGSRLAGGSKPGGALEEDPPSLTLRLGRDLTASAAVASVAPPGGPVGSLRASGRSSKPAAGERTPAQAARFPPIEWRRATSSGLPYAGSLAGGTRLPVEGPDWVTWNPVTDQRPNEPHRLVGHERTIRAVVSVLAAYRAAHPDAPKVLVGDISLPGGGPMDEHRSHQNGLDVDVYYPRLDRALRAPFSVDQVDRVLAQDLIDRFVAAGAQVVFVGYGTGLRGPSGVVVPYAYHDDHLHVRFGRPS